MADAYKVCPVCQDEDGTDPARNIKPMPRNEARRRANTAEFERFYEKWDAKHDPARLNPDFDPSLAERYPMTLRPDSIPEPEKA